MNREELIEEVAKAMHAGDLAASYASWDDSIEDTRNVSRRRARAALAVFERAHTPTEAHEKPVDTSPEPVKNRADFSHVTSTDDERGALSEFLFTVYEHGSQPNALREADAILSFLRARRTVQGEPSDAAVRAALSAWFQRMIAGGWDDTHEARMRAALRAAAATQ